MTRIAVLGDGIHDVFVRGQVHRMSPEAPVPILSDCGPQDRRDGGAANVAAHLRALGHDVTLYSLPSWPVKTRYMVGDRHILRVDVEREPRRDEQAHVWDRLRDDLAVGAHDMLVVSDYHKGSVPQTEPRDGWPWGNFKGPCLADAKHDFWRFDTFDVIKGNEHAQGLHSYPTAVMLATAVVVTRGDMGCTLTTLTGDAALRVRRLPAASVHAIDVTGAGDTFMAYLAHHLTVSPADFEGACRLANAAAAVAVQHSGTYVVQPDEIPTFASYAPDTA